jgi:hypothetical protein
LLFFILFNYPKYGHASLDLKDLHFIISKIMSIGKWVKSRDANFKEYYIQVETQAPSLEIAKNEAFKFAVQQALGTLVFYENEIRDRDLVRNDLILYSAGYVNNFNIVKKKEVEGGVIILMDVWVSESKISQRLLNLSINNYSIEGEKISTQLSTYNSDREDANKIVEKILYDFPYKAFDISIFNNSRHLIGNNMKVIIPLKIKWNKDFISALEEILIKSSDYERQKKIEHFYSQSTIGMIGGVFSRKYLTYNDREKLQLFLKKFYPRPSLQISIFDSDKNIIISNCFEFVNGDNVYYNIFIDRSFYTYETINADIEIFKNFEVDSDAEILIKYNKENELKISSMKKIEAKIVPHNACYEKSI